ncbi:hypothetical protein [Glaciibacter psychrotolerans]|uniref:Uncharacterized protein n=1 Tax=Glaciibacter psychrotolerans TaxID=670054 RepID=A0A7Z0EBI6_9MICO|nr:hypothetical protein [Leifsonia psychrotolerans]NYJ18570.1 hypothetical protein [Leifsonia psychrotolerans]
MPHPTGWESLPAPVAVASRTRRRTVTSPASFRGEQHGPQNGLSPKIQRAKELAVDGLSVEIVTEQTFLEILAL